ncbi:AMP-binding protein [Aquimarina rhabdastrellae]
MNLLEPNTIPEIHHNFKLNKQSLNAEDLRTLSYELIKDGEVFEQEIGQFLLDWLDDKDFIYVKTSGSTGKPKKIKILKRHMINSALATGEFFKVKEKTTALLCLPATYIAGKMMLVRAMVLGWKLDVVPPKMNPLDAVYKQYDFCAMVPLQLDNSLNRLHLLKKLIVGGGVISENLKTYVQDIDTKIYETYGMTETVTHIAARRINPKKKEPKAFKVLPNIKLSVDDRNCLVIKAPQLSDQIITTNDIVELITYKKFLWKGRFDNVINSGGVKMFPEEIETKLQKLILQRFIITSLPDDALGEKLIMIIESEHKHSSYNTLGEDIQKLEDLTRYECPKEIYFLPQFVEANNGKIQRKKTLALLIENLNA